MSKIIYLTEQPLDERNYDRFGIQTWIDREWDVEIWDLTPLAHPRIWQKFIESGRKLKEFEGYFPVVLKSQLDYRYSKCGKIEHFIDFTGDNYYSVREKMRLSRIGATRVICAVGSIPEFADSRDSQKRGFVIKFRKGIAGKGPIKSFKWLVNVLFRKLAAPFFRPGLAVVSGEESMRLLSAEYNCDILKAHNLDYDIYLRLNKSSIGGSAGMHGVFIDQDCCFHPDRLYRDATPYVSPEKYFPAICNGLRKISHVLDVNFRVAAHPRASYQRRVPDYFEGIPIEYGRTAELIRDCKIAVCHASASIQFAVLFRKPIIFVTTDELVSQAVGKSTAKFARLLGKTVINLDGDLDSVDWQKELCVDSQKYDEYRNQYIKIDGSPEKPHWDIVIDHIERKKSVRRASAGV